MCIGLDLCSKKNCLEQERCLFPTEPKFKSPCEVRRGPKKKKDKVRRTNEKCQFGKLPCRRQDTCTILGECVLEHKLVKENPDLYSRIQSSKSILTILKLFTRVAPPKSLRKKK